MSTTVVPPESQAANQHCLKLAAMPSAVQSARRHARWLLSGWELGDLVDETEVVVSELVTNAVKATGIVTERPGWSELSTRLSLICLCVYPYRGGVVVEVWAKDAGAPVRRPVGPGDEGGRELLLVEELCERWGYRWPTTGGRWGQLSWTIHPS
jgi:anti-sigma regulatory factor (Ser/Thr protein kinase)